MIYYLTLLVFPDQCHIFVHVVTAGLYSHVIIVAISEAFLNRLYIPSSLLNSLLDYNIMYKSTKHYTEIPFFFFEFKKLVYVFSYSFSVKSYIENFRNRAKAGVIVRKLL